MIFAIIVIIVLLLLMLKYVTKKVKLKKVDLFLGKIHSKVAIVLMAAAFIHMILAFDLIDSRPIYMYITGIAAMISICAISLSGLIRKRLGTKWKLIHRVGSVCILAIVLVHVSLYFYSISTYQNSVSNIYISKIDVSTLKDGIYEGEYDVEYIFAKVSVIIKNGEIIDIDILEHRNERGVKAERLIDDVIREQRIDVDAISGATNSSKVIKKAIENAIKNAQ